MNEGQKPNFSGNGVAVWVNRTQEGEQYLTVKLLDSIIVRAFKNKPKPQPVNEEIQI